QAEVPGFAVPCILAAAITRARTAVVEHNAEWQRLADTTEIPPALIARFRRIEAALLRRVDDVIAVSTVDRDQLVDAGVRRERVTVIPHGVDVAGFERAAPNDLRQRLGLPPGVPLLFFHGTLHYEPNTVALRVLVDEILPRLEASGTRVQVVAGGMNPPSDIVHPWLHYTGVIHDLAAAIAAADLCVVPLLAGGGTRLKLLEYLAAGRPTLSTLKGAEGLRVHDGDEMALVADGDWDGFCARIRGLLADPAGAAALGNRGQTFARRYDWSAICGAYVDLYEGRGRGSDLSGGIEPGGATTRAPAARRSRWRLLAEKLGATVGSPCRVPRAARPGESTVAHEPRTRPPAPRRPRRETSNAQRASDRRGARNWRTQAPEPGAPGIDFDAAITSHLPATPRWTTPRAAIVMLNRRCNLRCEFCDHWRHRDDLPRALVDRLIEQAG
ncbi:MAG: glycosyltransferase family 4 protein, partial [Myxococcota bacterium]|nr:glycosyltransferase family 4 protein [Myxococcota bacterium]